MVAAPVLLTPLWLSGRRNSKFDNSSMRMVCATRRLSLHPLKGKPYKAEGVEGKTFTDAGVRTVAKSDQVTVNPDQAREVAHFVVQPLIDIEIVGVFTEDAR